MREELIGTVGSTYVQHILTDKIDSKIKFLRWDHERLTDARLSSRCFEESQSLPLRFLVEEGVAWRFSTVDDRVTQFAA